MFRRQKKTASVNHPSIESVLGGFLRFEDEDQAKDRLATLKRTFMLSKHQPDEAHAAILWVRGYEVTPDEESQGYRGNFAMIYYQRLESGKYTLMAQKLEADLSYHPEKERPKQGMPDWGHPVLRNVKQKVIYDTPEEAQNELQRLHEDFPKISIPCTHKMYIMMYNNAPDRDEPMMKIILQVIPAPEGGFIIDWQENDYDPAKDPKKRKRKSSYDGTQKGPAAVSEETAEQGGGYFASKVKLQQHKPTGKPDSTPTE